MGEDESRLIALEGCFNFRDLGGYPTKDGRMIRWRRLFRADGLNRLTDVDMTLLDDLGVNTVIDLRTSEELAQRGRVPEGGREITYHHLPMIDVLPDPKQYTGWVDAAFVTARYQDMLADGRPAVAQALTVMADPAAYPLVFHCAAGKDRTGILAAIVLALLGVPDDLIVADYALSRDAMQRMLDALRAEHPEAAAELDQRSSAVLSAEPEVIAGLLDGVRQQHGSIEEYARHLGLGDEPERLREHLLTALR